MTTIADQFAMALQYHQSGSLYQAAHLYRQILQADPCNADAHQQLGVVLFDLGQIEQAADAMRQAIALTPDAADYHFNLGVVCDAAGQLEKAAASYAQAVRLRPDFTDAHNNLGNAFFRQGKRDDAAASYREALRFRPDHAGAHCNLGAVLVGQGNLAEAEDHYLQALRCNPNYPEAHNNLGSLYLGQRKLNEAVGHCRQAIRQRPDFPEAHHTLADALQQQGAIADALTHWQMALNIRPNYPDALNSLGNALFLQDRLTDAEACYREALRYNPRFAKAYNGLGNVQDRLKKPDEAMAAYREALRLNPDLAEAANNLGNVLKQQDKYDEAIACYREALRLNPNYPDAYYNLGIAVERNDFDEAVRCYRRALEIQPDFADACNNLGNALICQDQFEEGLRWIEQAVIVKPQFAMARWNRAAVWLLRGDFERGWPEYEWRWQRGDFAYPDFKQPLWDGSDLAGRTILLFGEQGLGDTLQFIRYAELVKQRGGHVIVECQPPLLQILASVRGIDRLVARGSPLPDFDVQAPLLSLPGILHTTLENVPADVPYLQARPDLVEHWRRELAASGGWRGEREARSVERGACGSDEEGGGAQAVGLAPETSPTTLHPLSTTFFKIGIAWQGSLTYVADRHRSIPIKHFAPLFEVPGVQLIGLQKDEGGRRKDERESTPPCDSSNILHPSSFILYWPPNLDEANGPFMDTAAIMKNLDLVITSDTAVAHLAGALGVPVWVALAAVPDWRWLLERADSPWYPTMRLFRQSRLGDWVGVFERIADELRTVVASAKPG